jgi:hypothetical protein
MTALTSIRATAIKQRRIAIIYESKGRRKQNINIFLIEAPLARMVSFSFGLF